MSTWPFKIVVKFASRGRKQRFFDGLDNIFSTCEFPDRLLVLISLDTDDIEMHNDEVKEKLSTYKNIVVDWGYPKIKYTLVIKDLKKSQNTLKIGLSSATFRTT